MKTHKDLDVWKLGMDLVANVYLMTKEFPKTEMYGLTSQMRRAAVSVPSNIAEGAARKGNKENLQFLYIALGSLSELETQAIIASRLAYLKNETIQSQIEQLRPKLLNYIKYIKTKINL